MDVQMSTRIGHGCVKGPCSSGMETGENRERVGVNRSYSDCERQLSKPCAVNMLTNTYTSHVPGCRWC